MIRPIAIFYLVSLFCRQSDTVCQLRCSISLVYKRVRCNEDSSKIGSLCGERIYLRCDTWCAYNQFIFLMHWLMSITKVKSDEWLGYKNIKRMEFNQNLPPIRRGYVYKNNVFHVGGSKILVEMCWSSPCAHRADILLSGKQRRCNRYGSDTASK